MLESSHIFWKALLNKWKTWGGFSPAHYPQAHFDTIYFSKGNYQCKQCWWGDCKPGRLSSRPAALWLVSPIQASCYGEWEADDPHVVDHDVMSLLVPQGACTVSSHIESIYHSSCHRTGTKQMSGSLYLLFPLKISHKHTLEIYCLLDLVLVPDMKRNHG